ncbi:disease resistance protein RUN1-like [Rosa rugosa]|uniref:disease resistance protein RUN1-like n=1 Tax=Rosa rugosa TaxID=74645 RepID=UPI002B4084A0|nr:disease resistance protein RUN1-like [Rosa rugosa]
MATQPEAPSTSSSTHTASCTYDVFLSFRGKDTRYGFTGHLYSALEKKGIKTFMDNKLDRGEEISRSLLDTIERSKIAIVVFSENFAFSRWCLDELVKILQCKLKQQIVRVVFYKVQPCHVRSQTESFGEALADHEKRFKEHREKTESSASCQQKRSFDQAFGDPESTFRQNMDTLAKWRSSLTEAAGLSGCHYSTGYTSNNHN